MSDRNDDKSKKGSAACNLLWDGWCVASCVGIWPRFIEPNLLSCSRISLPLRNLPKALCGIKIAQFSDLHLHSTVSKHYLKKIIRKLHVESPDLIVFTGDFLCFSHLESELLREFLAAFSAPYGCYAILGNHDYQRWISIDSQGNYGLPCSGGSLIGKGMSRLFKRRQLSGRVTAEAAETPMHSALIDLLEKSPFALLHNQTRVVEIGNSALNICGLGEHMLGKCLPQMAFQNYEAALPGLVLLHNPDAIPSLADYPGDLILCGHTHGAQVNLPILRERLSPMEEYRYVRGIHKDGSRWVYVNRGVGSTFFFRWFSTPEITTFTLVST